MPAPLHTIEYDARAWVKATDLLREYIANNKWRQGKLIDEEGNCCAMGVIFSSKFKKAEDIRYNSLLGFPKDMGPDFLDGIVVIINDYSLNAKEDVVNFFELAGRIECRRQWDMVGKLFCLKFALELPDEHQRLFLKVYHGEVALKCDGVSDYVKHVGEGQETTHYLISSFLGYENWTILLEPSKMQFLFQALQEVIEQTS